MSSDDGRCHRLEKLSSLESNVSCCKDILFLAGTVSESTEGVNTHKNFLDILILLIQIN